MSEASALKIKLFDEHEEENIYISNDDEDFAYIKRLKNGEIERGRPFGIPELDKYWLLKRNTLTIINGHDNVGKSVVIWFLMVLASKLYGDKWLVFSSENRTASAKMKMCEFYLNKKLDNMTDEELTQAFAFVRKHFRFIKTSISEDLPFMKLIEIGKKEFKKEKFDGFLIDPYNSVDIDPKLHKELGSHEYHYKALKEFRKFKDDYCSVYINAHAVTEALRKVFYKSHEFEGLPMPPNKSDTEQGGKFSNRADDFITIHRMTQHPSLWMMTEIHVRKIKESETGGSPTIINEPVRLKMVNGCGFVSAGKNPIDEVGKEEELKQQIRADKNYTNFKLFNEEEEDDTDDIPW